MHRGPRFVCVVAPSTDPPNITSAFSIASLHSGSRRAMSNSCPVEPSPPLSAARARSKANCCSRNTENLSRSRWKPSGCSMSAPSSAGVTKAGERALLAAGKAAPSRSFLLLSLLDLRFRARSVANERALTSDCLTTQPFNFWASSSLTSPFNSASLRNSRISCGSIQLVAAAV